MQREETIRVPDTLYTRYGKRALDICISLLAVVVTLPINLILAVITFFDVGRPIVFKQTRTGKDFKPFTIYKFRNMRNDVDEDGYILPPRERVTRFGRFVRATSLDELLQFWSILFGKMSIIGPRPLKQDYINLLNDRHKMRYAVRPGLECPSHIPLDHARTWNDQFENDVWYVQNVSFKTDLKLTLMLFKMVFDRKYAKTRSGAMRGSFVGYSNGCAVGKILSDQERMRRKIAAMQRRYEALYGSVDVQSEEEEHGSIVS